MLMMEGTGTEGFRTEGDQRVQTVQRRPADVAAIPSLTYLSSIAEANASFAPAATLLKVWSRQRGLQKVLGLDHIGYVITLLLAYLVTGASKPTRKIPAGSSAWQLFKGCIDAMGTFTDPSYATSAHRD